jgi:arylsulfatase A-like enzyme
MAKIQDFSDAKSFPSGKAGKPKITVELPLWPLMAVNMGAFAVAFAVAKIVILVDLCMESQGLYGLAALSPYRSLFALVASDVLLGLLVALFTAVSRRGASALADLILVYYLINAHYAALFGTFLSADILNLGIDFTDLGDSFIAEINIFLVLGMVNVLLLRRMLSLLLAKLLARRGQIAAGLVLIMLTSALVLRFTEVPTRFPQFYPNPIEVAVFSLFDHTRDVDYNGEDTFVDISPFPTGVTHPKVPIQRSGEPLNVVIVQLESTGISAIRRPGEETMPTARLLAQTGVEFTDFYTTNPSTIKTYVALQCSVYPAASGRPITQTRPRFPCKALAEYFKDRGYRTGLFHGGNFAFTNKLAFLVDRGWDVMLDAKTIPNRESYRRQTWGIDDKAVFATATDWIDSSEKPFLVLISPILPHHPYLTPDWWTPPFPVIEKRDRYHNSVFYEDMLIGEMVKHLRNKGLLKQTVFVLVGDHGEAFNEHPFNNFHPVELYEENIRVPFIISNPLLFPTAHKTHAVGTMPDLLPTLLEVVGFGLEEYEGEGVSLLAPPPDRIVYFHTTFNKILHGLRDGHFKFIFEPRTKQAQLFDLRKDPSEQNNLTLQYSERVNAYSEMVEKWARVTLARTNQ